MENVKQQFMLQLLFSGVTWITDFAGGSFWDGFSMFRSGHYRIVQSSLYLKKNKILL